MIEVTNFFQAIFMFKNIMPVVRLNTAEVKLAVAIKDEALELMAIAEQEMRNGATTQTLSLKEKDQKKRRAFAEIALWHHKRAAEKYHKAADCFDEAGRVHTKKIRGFQAKAKEMRQHAAQAAAAVNALNDFLIQN
jgi:hypothetical protein